MSVDVVIIGGGLSGLVLGLFLASYKIKIFPQEREKKKASTDSAKSIILEKENEIISDP